MILSSNWIAIVWITGLRKPVTISTQHHYHRQFQYYQPHPPSISAPTCGKFLVKLMKLAIRKRGAFHGGHPLQCSGKNLVQEKTIFHKVVGSCSKLPSVQQWNTHMTKMVSVGCDDGSQSFIFSPGTASSAGTIVSEHRWMGVSIVLLNDFPQSFHSCGNPCALQAPLWSKTHVTSVSVKH